MKNLAEYKFLLFFILTVILISLTTVQCKNTQSTETEISELSFNEDNLLNGISKAICYSGFRKGQHPDRGNGAKNPSYDEILEDLTILSQDSNFKLIRVYDSGENSKMVLEVIEENNLDIKVMLGMWLRAEISNHEGCPWLNEPIPDSTLKKNKKLNLEEIERGIELTNKYKDIVTAVNVGNEALVDWNDHMVPVDTIIRYVEEVQESIDQPVTVADNYKWWALNGSDLAKTVDFISVHTYPIWEGKDINEGMSFTIENLQEVRDSLPGVKMVVSEAGWATTASEFEERASEEKQLQYYQEIMPWAKEMNITVFFFEAFDESWKGNPDNPIGAEKHWGIFTEDRKPKKVMENLYSNLK